MKKMTLGTLEGKNDKLEVVCGFDQKVDENKIRMDILTRVVEEMAGDKTEHGKRQPGEPCTYAGERQASE